MNIATALDHRQAAYERQSRLFEAKNHDYASNEEALGNGKAVAGAVKALGLAPLMETATGVYLFRVIEKVHRAINIVKARRARCEPLIDTMDDMSNFPSLAYLAMIDEGHIKVEEKKNE